MASMVAPMVLDSTINGVWFDAYVAQVLVSELRPGHVVIMDNLLSHKRLAAKGRGEAAGSTLRFPHHRARTSIRSRGRSPGSTQCSAGRLNVTSVKLLDLIGKLVNIFQPDECANYFKSCRHEPK